MQANRIVWGLCFVLCGCATTAKYEAALDSWVGATTVALVDTWGYPDQQMQAPDGNTAYIYHRQGSVVLPATTYTTAHAYGVGNQAFGSAYSTTYGGGVIQLNCETIFEIDDNHRVVSWNWKGNNCKSR